jgi:hypothetical protein
MLKLPHGRTELAPSDRSSWSPLPLRSVRPSLLDLRFTGDPWVVVDQPEGTISLRLDNYRLARIHTLPCDVPSLNSLLLQLRLWQTRRRLARRRCLRSRPPPGAHSRPAACQSRPTATSSKAGSPPPTCPELRR